MNVQYLLKPEAAEIFCQVVVGVNVPILANPVVEQNWENKLKFKEIKNKVNKAFFIKKSLSEIKKLLFTHLKNLIKEPPSSMGRSS